MGQFTSLDSADFAELADEFGLGAVRQARAVAAGTINTNFKLVTERGQFFLRINEGKTESDVAWEARLVTQLAADGVATPAPMVASNGLPYARTSSHDKWASVFPWRGGVHIAAHEVTPAHAGACGSTLAMLHCAGLKLPADWGRTSIYDHFHLMERFDRVSQSDDSALASAVEILREELHLASANAAVRHAATHGIIHGDLFRDNVLWDGERVAAVLDFEQASTGSLAYDLAVCINDWCWTNEPRLDLVKALLGGYQAVRPLSEADRTALPIEVRAAAARFTLTRITDVYLAKVDKPEKDFRAFLARSKAWRGPALGQLAAVV